MLAKSINVGDMRLLMLLFVVGALGIGAFSCVAQDDLTGQQSEYINLIGEADNAIAEERWSDAESLLLNAMREEPENPTNVLLMSNLGIVRLAAGKDSLALEILNRAAQIAPSSITVLGNRAKVLCAMGRDVEAYNDYSRIIELDSMAVDVRCRRGMLALYLGDTDTAEKDFVFVEHLAPGNENAAIGLALLYSSTNRPNDAITQYTKLIKQNPAVEYYSGRAALYLLTKQLNEASADIADGLALSPNDAELYLYRAYLNKLRYRNDDAEADLKRAIELGADPDRAALYYKIGK